jgi:sarcosine oxidase, subunit alpha
MRLGPRPGEVIDRNREFTFTWDGDEYPAYEGDTIASALAAVGVRVFSRSFKYHRPRGLLTAIARVVDARRGGDIIRVNGGSGVQSVECADGATVECDLLVTATGWTAPTSLLNMAGDRPAYSVKAARFFPSRLPDDVLATGSIAGDGTLDELLAHARATGEEAARRAARTAARWSASIPQSPDDREEPGGEPVQIPDLPFHEHPTLFQGGTHGIVDYSEDVSSKDIIGAVKEGYDSVELAKRYTTATMGPAQGKLETVNTVAVLAAATGRTIEGTGTTV